MIQFLSAVVGAVQSEGAPSDSGWQVLVPAIGPVSGFALAAYSLWIGHRREQLDREERRTHRAEDALREEQKEARATCELFFRRCFSMQLAIKAVADARKQYGSRVLSTSDWKRAQVKIESAKMRLQSAFDKLALSQPAEITRSCEEVVVVLEKCYLEARGVNPSEPFDDASFTPIANKMLGLLTQVKPKVRNYIQGIVKIPLGRSDSTN